MIRNKSRFITTGLVVSLGLSAALVHAQSAQVAQPQFKQAPGQPDTMVQPSGQPGAAPQVPIDPKLSQAQSLIQQAEQQAQEAEKKATAAAAERAQRMRKMREMRATQQDLTPEERAARRAARIEARNKELAEMSPELRAAREKELQARRAQIAALRAAKESQAKAEAAAQNAAKLNSDLEAARKPNPARGANFTPQNVMPLLQGLDSLTKQLATIKTPADLPPPQLAKLDQNLAQLKNYMDRVDAALEDVHRAGVQTPANKEAESLYMRIGDIANNLDAEMQRIEKLFANVPQVRTMFAKFRD